MKRGKFKEATLKFEEVKGFLEKNYLHESSEYVIFLGDYGELLYERGYHSEAQSCFREAMTAAEKLLNELSFDYQLQNANKKSQTDGVKICAELQLPSEIEEEILRKADRAQTSTNAKAGGAAAAAQKKDPKKAKDDPKAVAKGAANQKKGGAAGKTEEVKPELKVRAQLMPSYLLSQLLLLIRWTL